ncbi:hypothetical protein SCG7086_DC_00030 [Chlamydiales bacterium SCGC AG-110-P3]|nr:hypothetical protein SCG7086_DC_00030 [Chlamydiales bacterium SCGC AG-110-P3]
MNYTQIQEYGKRNPYAPRLDNQSENTPDNKNNYCTKAALAALVLASGIATGMPAPITAIVAGTAAFTSLADKVTGLFIESQPQSNQFTPSLNQKLPQSHGCAPDLNQRYRQASRLTMHDAYSLSPVERGMALRGTALGFCIDQRCINQEQEYISLLPKSARKAYFIGSNATMGYAFPQEHDRPAGIPRNSTIKLKNLIGLSPAHKYMALNGTNTGYAIDHKMDKEEQLFLRVLSQTERHAYYAGSDATLGIVPGW